MRSATSLPSTHPAAPLPITRNDAASASAGGSPRAEKLARRKTGIHVHIA
jgi:hypothetical protein